MTATKAQALAVALDHCEETGERLRQQGRILVGPTVRGPWRPKGAP